VNKIRGVFFLSGVVCLAALPMGRASDEPLDALAQGLAAFRAGQWDEALAQFNAALKADPDRLPARFWRGRAYLEQQQ